MLRAMRVEHCEGIHVIVNCCERVSFLEVNPIRCAQGVWMNDNEGYDGDSASSISDFVS